MPKIKTEAIVDGERIEIEIKENLITAKKHGIFRPETNAFIWKDFLYVKALDEKPENLKGIPSLTLRGEIEAHEMLVIDGISYTLADEIKQSGSGIGLEKVVEGETPEIKEEVSKETPEEINKLKGEIEGLKEQLTKGREMEVYLIAESETLKAEHRQELEEMLEQVELVKQEMEEVDRVREELLKKQQREIERYQELQKEYDSMPKLEIEDIDGAKLPLEEMAREIAQLTLINEQNKKKEEVYKDKIKELGKKVMINEQKSRTCNELAHGNHEKYKKITLEECNYWITGNVKGRGENIELKGAGIHVISFLYYNHRNINKVLNDLSLMFGGETEGKYYKELHHTILIDYYNQIIGKDMEGVTEFIEGVGNFLENMINLGEEEKIEKSPIFKEYFDDYVENTMKDIKTVDVEKIKKFF